MKKPRYHRYESGRKQTIESLDLVSPGYEENYDAVVRLLAAALKIPICLFSVVHEDRQFFKAGVGLDVRETTREVSFCGHVVADERDVMVVENALEDERFVDNPLVAGAPNIRFYAGALIRAPNTLPVGTICAIDRVPRTFNDAELNLIRDARHLLEVNLLLHQQSVLDRSTGLFTRDYFEQHIAHDWRRAFRNMLPLSLLLCRIDKFHELKDTFGYHQADDNLREAAGALRGALLRPQEMLVRYDEHEFVLFMPDADEVAALAMADRLREAVFGLNIYHPATRDRRVTVSVGGVVVDNADDLALGVGTALQVADDALFKNQSAGGNRASIERMSPSQADD